ncbi:MAG: polysaccharide pyruvyl transferase family protein [Chloroflexota bacterium]|nr:polysaccharide pyruvyl transferase family protein [Chloroflexota bacterium]
MIATASTLRAPEPILVVGGYGYRNIGDEAILAGLLTSLAGKQVTIVSRAPAETQAMHGVPSVGIAGALGALRRHRTLLIGGGGLFGSDMGRLGRLLPAYGIIAALSGRTVAVEGVDIDAGMPIVTRALVRGLLSRAAHVSVRDVASARTLEGWGVGVVDVEPDLSERMVPAAPSVGVRLLRESGIEPGRPVVGLSLTAVNDRMVGPILATIAVAMERHPGVQFCFIPMSQHPFVSRHNDLVLAQRLRRLRPELRIIEGDRHPAAILAVFGALDIAVCMRYHSLLFAHRCGVPIIPIAYADKCRRWLEAHDMAPMHPTPTAIADALAHLVPAARLAS